MKAQIQQKAENDGGLTFPIIIAPFEGAQLGWIKKSWFQAVIPPLWYLELKQHSVVPTLLEVILWIGTKKSVRNFAG